MIQRMFSLDIVMFWFCFVLLCFVAFGESTDTQGTGIVYTADRRICQKITWKLESQAVYVNVTGVLKGGDGKERNVQGRVLSGLVNITTSKTEICCPGFYKNHKRRCKRCRNNTYGLDCVNECNCTVVQKCDRRTGECKKCKVRRCEDNEGEDDDTSTLSNTVNSVITDVSVPAQTTTDSKNKNVLSTVRTCDVCKEFGNCSSEQECSVFSDLHESSSIFTIVSHTTLFHRQKMTTKSSTNTQQIDVSVFPTAEESKQDPKTAIQRSDVSTPIVAISVVVPLLVMIILLALLVKRYHGRNNVKKRGTTESVHKLMRASSHKMNESQELTRDSFGYKDLDGNRVYVSMYNAMNVNVHHEDSVIEGKSKDLQYISMHLQYLTESMRQSVQNDHETVESK